MSQTILLRSLGLFHRTRKQKLKWFDACFKGKNKANARSKIINKQFNDIYTLEQLARLITIADVNNIQNEKDKIKVWYNIFQLINNSINHAELTANQLEPVFKLFPVTLDFQIFLMKHYPLLAVRNKKFTVDHKIAVAGAFEHFFKVDIKQKDKQVLPEANAIGAEHNASIASSKVYDEIDKLQSSDDSTVVYNEDVFIQQYHFFKIFKHFVNAQASIVNTFTSLLDEVKDVFSIAVAVDNKANFVNNDSETIYVKGKQALREYIYKQHALINMETSVYATTPALRDSSIWEKLYKERHEDFAQAFSKLNKNNKGVFKLLEAQRSWLTGKHILYLVPNLLKYFQNSNINPGKGFNYFLSKTKKAQDKRPLDKLRAEIQEIITHYNDSDEVNDKDKEVFLKVLQNDQVRGMLNLSTKSVEELLANTGYEPEICKIIALDRYLLAKIKKENLEKNPYLKIADEVTKEIAKQNNWFEHSRINSYLRNFVESFNPNNAEHREKCWYIAAQPKLWHALCALKIPQPSLFFKHITPETTGRAVAKFMDMSPFFKAKLSGKNIFETVNDRLYTYQEDFILDAEVKKAAENKAEALKQYQEWNASAIEIQILTPVKEKDNRNKDIEFSPKRKLSL